MMTKERSAVIGLSPVQGSDEIDNGLFVLARLGTGDDDLVLSRGTLNAGLFVPLHRHDDIECIHVAAGSIDVYLGDRRQWFTVDAGSSIVVAGGVAHAIRNVTDQPVDAFAMMTVRLSRFLRDLGAIARAAGNRSREERMQSLRELGDEYGYWMAPAEESDAIRGLPASAA
jgi:quercetin dioxygenase-like cupin family protein